MAASIDSGSWHSTGNLSQHNKISLGVRFVDLCNTCQGIKVGVNIIFPINTNTGQGSILSPPLKKQAWHAGLTAESLLERLGLQSQGEPWMPQN